MPRSLRVQQDCIDKVKLALRQNGFPSQRALAEEVGLALTTVSHFLTGKPVDYATFEELCRRLALDWRSISALDFEVLSQTTDNNPKNPESLDVDRDTLPCYPSGAVPLGSPFTWNAVPLKSKSSKKSGNQEL